MGSSSMLVFAQLATPHAVPYAIIAINFLLFNLARSFVNKVTHYYSALEEEKKLPDSSPTEQITPASTERTTNTRRLRQSAGRSQTSWGEDERKNAIREPQQRPAGWKWKFIKVLAHELISTCELCADCAELNVVYEKHGTLAYGLSLFILTYFWLDTFGEAHTTPGYMVEDYFLVQGNQLLRSGDAYARFVGQSLAMPLAWRLASFYWRYNLLNEHSAMLVSENCRSALTTSTLNGFLIELVCCLICRLLELIGHQMLERQMLSKRVISLMSSFVCTSLVVLALELSGGYFNPVLASSLEFGCKGAHRYQHALVFWVGPLLGHLLARAIYKRVSDEASNTGTGAGVGGEPKAARRKSRSGSTRKKRD